MSRVSIITGKCRKNKAFIRSPPFLNLFHLGLSLAPLYGGLSRGRRACRVLLILFLTPFLGAGIFPFAAHAELTAKFNKNTRAEGQTLKFSVSMPNLTRTDADVLVTIQPKDGFSQDVTLTRSAFYLSERRKKRTVIVEVLEDGIPEPGEEVILEAKATVMGETVTATDSFWAPRHGYKVEGLQTPSQKVGVQQDVMVEVKLNGVVGDRVAGMIQASSPGMENRVEDFEVPDGLSTASVKFVFPNPGTYTFTVIEAAFEPTGNRHDQVDLLEGVEAPTERLTVTSAEDLEVQTKLKAVVQDAVIREGGFTTLTVSAVNLFPGDGEVEVYISISSTDDVSVTTERVTLDSEARTQTVMVRAHKDDIAEPREAVRLEVRAADAVSSATTLTIPRHGYAVSALTPSIRRAPKGSTATVKITLNAPVPKPVMVSVRVQISSATAGLEGGTAPGGKVDVKILAGERSGEEEITSYLIQMAGVYTLLVSGACFLEDACFSEEAPNNNQDQTVLEEGPGISQTIEILAPPEVDIFLDRDILMEGEVADLVVRAKNLLDSHNMLVTVTAVSRTDVVLSPNTVRISARKPTARMEIEVLEDDAPEPREAITLLAVGSADVGRLMKRASFVIPRHGYAVQQVQVEPKKAPAGSTVTVEVVLSGDAPSDAELKVRWASMENTDATNGRELQLQIAAGERIVRGAFAPAAGTYIVSVSAATFAKSEPGDQQVLPSTATARLQVILPPVILSMRLDQTIAREGEDVSLWLTAHNLEHYLQGDETLEVRVAPDEAHALDVSSKTVFLSVATPTTQTIIRMAKDDAPEPRETIHLTASAQGAVSVATTLTIPRHGYALDLVISVPQVRPGENAKMEARLNAPAPAPVLVGGALKDPADSDTLSLSIDLGDDAGSWDIPLRMTGNYDVRIIHAVFSDSIFENNNGDQMYLEIRDPDLKFKVLAEGPGLFLELTGIDGAGEVSEGVTLTLKVVGDSLRIGEPLEVSLSAPEGYEADLLFSPSSFQLMAGRSSQTVQVGVRSDSMPEPRETLQITATAPFRDLLLRRESEKFALPRHGYAVRAFTVEPAKLAAGDMAELQLELNAPAPSAVTAVVTVTPALGGGASETLELIIAENQRSGGLFFQPRRAGNYEIKLTSALFAVPAEGADQEGPQSVGFSAAIQVLDPPRLVLSLDRPFLLEGQTATLTALAEGLLPERRLRVLLSADPDGEVEFSATVVELTAQTTVLTVQLTALHDDAPEPREKIRLTASAQGAVSGATTLTIPRNDYALVDLVISAPQARPGENARLEVRLNAPAPAPVFVYGAQRGGHPFPMSLELSIDLGDAVGSWDIPLRMAGNYGARIIRAVFSDSIFENNNGDQVYLEIRDPDLEFEVLAEGPGLFLELIGIDGAGEVSEGVTLTLKVTGDSLRIGESLAVSLSAPEGYEADLLFSSTTFQLTPLLSSRTVQVGVLSDDMPEPREVLQITATAPFGVWSLRRESEKFAIPRHGYEVQTFTAEPAQLTAKDMTELQLELNAPAPSTVTAVVTVTPALDGGASETLELTIAENERFGSLFLQPRRAGDYELKLTSTLFAAPVEGADQEGPQGADFSATLQVLSPPRLRLTLGDRAFLKEGNATTLTVLTENLLSEERLRVLLSATPGGEVEFSKTVVELTAQTTAQTVQLTALHDGAPEPREPIRLTASAQGAVSDATTLTIPFNDYVLKNLWLSMPQARLGTTVSLVVRLNAPAPAPVSVKGVQKLLGSEEDGHAVKVAINTGDAMGTAPVPFSKVGNYEVKINNASFDRRMRLPDDQEVLEIQEDKLLLRFRALAAEPRLFLEWIGLDDAAEVAEDAALTLRVSGDSLFPGEALQVSLSVVPDAHAADLIFSTSTFQLTTERSSQTVQVAALSDDMPEPREMLQITATAPFRGVMLRGDSEEFSIPRHGYAVSAFTVEPAQLNVGRAAELRLELNAPAPSAVTALVTITPALDGSTSETLKLIIGEKQSSGGLSLQLDRTGDYELELISALFAAPPKGADQKGPQSVGSSATLQVLDETQLVLTLDRAFLQEGDEAVLTVRIEDLLGGRMVRVNLDTAGRTDVRLSTSTVLLSADVMQTTLTVTLLRDDRAEPRETLAVRGSVDTDGLMLEAVAEFTVARHGFVGALRVRPEALRPGTTATVEVELNAAAPVEARTTLEIEFDGEQLLLPELELVIAADQSVGRYSFVPDAVGAYEISVRRLSFNTGAGSLTGPPEQLDQNSPIPVTPDSVTLRSLEDSRLELSLDRELLAEGETTTLTVLARSLLPGESLTALITADLAEEVEFSTTRVALSATTPERTVRVTARIDDQTPEPRETVTIMASDADSDDVAAAETELQIGWNGYAVEQLKITPPEARPGATVTVEVTLNGEAPADGRLRVQWSLQGSVEGIDDQGLSLQFRERERIVRKPFVPAAGTYIVFVSSATFTEGEPEDQRMLLSTLTVQVTVTPVRLIVELLDSTNGIVAEGDGAGETAQLRVSAVNLFPGEQLEAALSVPPEHEDDFLSGATQILTLLAGQRTRTVTVRVRNDDDPEPRERIRLTVSARGAISAATTLTIPRDDYAVIGLRLAVSQVRLGEPASFEVLLNAPAPAPVIMGIVQYGRCSLILGNMRLDLDDDIPDDRGLSRIWLREAGDCRVVINEALFYDEFEPGDQVFDEPDYPDGNQALDEIKYLNGDQAFLEIRQGELKFKVLAAEPRLFLEWIGLNNAARVSEGSTLTLLVIGDSLFDGEPLQVSLSVVPDAHAADVLFSTSTFQLTTERSSRTVQVGVQRDGRPEPRETLRLRAMASSTRGLTMPRDSEKFSIPRHGYVVNAFTLEPKQLNVGSQAALRLELNALAPSTVTAVVRVTPALDGGAYQTLELIIGENQRAGSLSLRSQRAGEYELELASALFTAPPLGGDQGGPLGVGSSVTWRVLDPTELVLELDRAFLREGDEAVLTVRVDNLLGERRVRVHLDTADRTDVRLSTSTVLLSAVVTQTTLTVTLLRDDRAEPRETLELRGSVDAGGLMLEAAAEFRVARHGFVGALRVRPEALRPGTTATVEVELNAAAPVEARTFLEIEFDGEQSLLPELVIAADQNIGRYSFVPDAVGAYEISVKQLDFTAFLGSLTGLPEQLDQIGIPVAPDSVTLRSLEGSRSERYLGRDVLAEGGTTTLTAPRSRRSSGTGKFSAGSSALSQSSVTAPHNGHALTALRAEPLEVEPNETFTVEAELNAPAPRPALGRLLLSRVSDGEENTKALPVDFQVEAGQAVGSVRHALAAPGVYHGVVDALWFAEDVEETEEEDIAVRTDMQILLRVGVRLELDVTLERRVVAEGAGVVLTVNAMNLGFGEEAALRLETTEEYREDLHLMPAAVQLIRPLGGAGAVPGQFQIDVLHDGLPEPREAVPLVLHGVPTHGDAVSLPAGALVIPRNDYAVSHFRVRASAGRPSDRFSLEAGLNRGAESTVRITVRAFERDTDMVSGRALLEIGPGASTGSAVITLPTAGTHTWSVSTASFTHSLLGDQEELLVDVMEITVNVGPLLDLGGSQSRSAAVRTVLSQVWELLLYFEGGQSDGVVAGPAFCTEEVRNAPEVTGRLPCLDVDGNGAADRRDVVLIQRYMDFLHLIAAGDVASSIIVSGTDLQGSPEQTVNEIIHNIQGLFPRPECRALGLCY